MGATLAGCRAVAVPPRADGTLDLDAVDDADAARALCLWVNSPANPSGQLDDLAAAAAWGRARGVPVLSDECYVEFTWDGPPRTILEHGTEGVLAVHSLSKRSNLAGVRAGFYAGDAELVEYLREVRKHAGLMVPGPVQAAAVAAWADDAHVDEQRPRYRRPAGAGAAILAGIGHRRRPARGRLLPLGAGARRRRVGADPPAGRAEVARWWPPASSTVGTTTCASPWCSPTTVWRWSVDRLREGTMTVPYQWRHVPTRW